MRRNGRVIAVIVDVEVVTLCRGISKNVNYYGYYATITSLLRGHCNSITQICSPST